MRLPAKTENKLFAGTGLATARIAMGLTQVEMAQMLAVMIEKSISTDLYRSWEQGRLGVTPSVAMRVCRALDCSVGELWHRL